MTHLILLGDSIFDNAAYVGEQPDVIEQLRAKLPEGWNATLKAIDGLLSQSFTVYREANCDRTFFYWRTENSRGNRQFSFAARFSKIIYSSFLLISF